MLDVKHMMLHPLDRSGVVEAIEGPAAHFGLVIKPDRNSMQAGERTLAEFLTMTCSTRWRTPRPSRNRRSPHAPDLADPHVGGGLRPEPGGPAFDRLLYQKLKGKGFKLDEVIQQQFDKIAGIGACARRSRRGCCLTCSSSLRPARERPTRTPPRDPRPLPATLSPRSPLDALLEACQSRSAG